MANLLGNSGSWREDRDSLLAACRQTPFGVPPTEPWFSSSSTSVRRNSALAGRGGNQCQRRRDRDPCSRPTVRKRPDRPGGGNFHRLEMVQVLRRHDTFYQRDYLQF